MLHYLHKKVAHFVHLFFGTGQVVCIFNPLLIKEVLIKAARSGKLGWNKSTMVRNKKRGLPHVHVQFVPSLSKRVCIAVRTLFFLLFRSHFAFHTTSASSFTSLLYLSNLVIPPSSFYLFSIPPSLGLTSGLRLLCECYYSIALHLDNHRLATPNWSRAEGGV